MPLLSLIGRLGLDTSGFEGGLKKADSAATGFAASVHQKLGATLGAVFSVAYVEQWIRKVHDAQTEVAQLAKQYSVTTDEVQLLQKAAGRLHLEFNDVAGAIERVNKARAEASQGGPQGQRAADMFNKLGVSDRDIVDQSKSAFDLLKQIGETASKNTKSLEIQNAEFELLGKSATSIKNVLIELSKISPVELFDKDSIARAEEVDRLMKSRQRELARTAAPYSEMWDRFKLGAFNGTREAWNYPDEQGWSKWSLKSGAARGFSPVIGAIQGLLDVISPSEEFGSALPEVEKAIAKRDQKAKLEAEARKIRAVAAPKDDAGKIPSVHGITTHNGAGSLSNVGGYFFGDSANAKLTDASTKTAQGVQELLTEVKSMRASITEGGAV